MSLPSTEIQDFFEDRRQIQAFFSRRGGMDVYRSVNSADEDELVFVIANQLERDPEEVLRKRAAMRGIHIARLNEAGVFPSGAGYWVCRLDLACRFDEMLAEWHQNPTRILRLIEHSVRGLMEVHDSGHFHGDMRAGNIWVRINQDGSEEAFLVGMALDYWQNLEAPEQLTVELARYMAPERITGDPPSKAADIYAMGILLYRGLFGVYPYDAEDAWSITAASATESLIKPSTDFPMDDALWALISRCLDKNPENRPSEPKSIIQALQPYLNFERPVFHLPPPEPLMSPPSEPSIHQLNRSYEEDSDIELFEAFSYSEEAVEPSIEDPPPFSTMRAAAQGQRLNLEQEDLESPQPLSSVVIEEPETSEALITPQVLAFTPNEEEGSEAFSESSEYEPLSEPSEFSEMSEFYSNEEPLQNEVAETTIEPITGSHRQAPPAKMAFIDDTDGSIAWDPQSEEEVTMVPVKISVSPSSQQVEVTASSSRYQMDDFDEPTHAKGPLGAETIEEPQEQTEEVIEPSLSVDLDEIQPLRADPIVDQIEDETQAEALPPSAPRTFKDLINQGLFISLFLGGFLIMLCLLLFFKA